MSFEPKVLQSIEQYQKKTGRDRLLLMAPFFLAVLLALAILVATALLHGSIAEFFKLPEGTDGEYWLNQATLFIKIIAGFGISLLVAGLGYNLFAAVRYARARFELFTTQQTLDYAPISAQKFIEALDGAAIGAGVEAPCMVVLDDPAANAAAFESDQGTQSVGITAGMLAADISVSEANAVMAHELAHLFIGENVHAPMISDVEFQPSLWLIVFGIVSLSSVLAAPRSITYVLLEVFMIAAAVAVLTVIYRSETFIMKLLDLAHQHDDLLADSLAVKITRDPASMKSAIKKVEELAVATGRVPGGTILARYLFVTPPTRPGDYFRYATKAAGEVLGGRRQPRTWLLFSRPANDATRKVLELESRMTVERLINLDLIEQGRWRALEDWSRD